MHYFAVIDTNVIVSALFDVDENSNPVKVYRFVQENRVTPVMSVETVAEYKDVLNRPKFPFTKEQVDETLELFDALGEYVVPFPLDVEFKDPKDLAFYEVVMTKRTEDDAQLVTGNSKHFPTRPFIVTPAQFVKIVEGNKIPA